MLVRCSSQPPDSTFCQNLDLLLLNLKTFQHGAFVGRKLNVWRFSEDCNWEAKHAALRAQWPSHIDYIQLFIFISVVIALTLQGKLSSHKKEMFKCVLLCAYFIDSICNRTCSSFKISFISWDFVLIRGQRPVTTLDGDWRMLTLNLRYKVRVLLFWRVLHL